MKRVEVATSSLAGSHSQSAPEKKGVLSPERRPLICRRIEVGGGRGLQVEKRTVTSRAARVGVLSGFRFVCFPRRLYQNQTLV